MSGHVFHPGHDHLHGVTVVVSGASGVTYLGRWHERAARGVTLRDVAIHDPVTNDVPLPEWLDRQRRFGVAAQEKLLVIPNDEARDVATFEPD